MRGDYVAAAGALDRRGTDVVVIQHEYGIFGGADGEYVLSLADELRHPFVVTLHTVLAPAERAPGRRCSRELCARAALVTVFTETARRMVVDDAARAPDERVRVVPHGAPTALLPRTAAAAAASRRCACAG